MGIVRRHLVAVLCGLALSASTIGCVSPPGTGSGEADPTRFVDKVFTDVDVTRDVIYRSTTTYNGLPVDLRLNIYEPRGDTRSERPVMMWMFGGAWAFGDRNQLENYAIDSAQRGYVGVTIDYRIRWELLWGLGDLVFWVDAGWDAYDDSVASVEWLKANAGEHRLDPDAIVAGGVSAGGINALNLLYAKDRGPETSPIAGAVSISGLSFVRASPGDPPAIMHHGTLDTEALNTSAKQTCDGSVAAGNVCEWVWYEGGDHYIVWWNAEEIMDRSAEFVFEQVLVPQGYGDEA